MGNTQSNPDQVSLEEFKDQIFGTTVFLLSKATNPHLEFRSKEECNGDQLPLPKIDSDNIYEIALSYYNFPENRATDKDLDYQIEDYVNKNILNSKENVTRFYKILIERLLAKEPKKLTEKSMISSQHQPQELHQASAGHAHIGQVLDQSETKPKAPFRQTYQSENGSFKTSSQVKGLGSKVPLKSQSVRSLPNKPAESKSNVSNLSKSRIIRSKPENPTSFPQNTYQQKNKGGYTGKSNHVPQLQQTQQPASQPRPRVSKEYQLTYPRNITESGNPKHDEKSIKTVETSSNFTNSYRPVKFNTCLLSETDSMVLPKENKSFKKEIPKKKEESNKVTEKPVPKEEYSPHQGYEEEQMDEEYNDQYDQNDQNDQYDQDEHVDQYDENVEQYDENVDQYDQEEHIQQNQSYEEYDGDELEYEEYETIPE